MVCSVWAHWHSFVLVTLAGSSKETSGGRRSSMRVVFGKAGFPGGCLKSFASLVFRRALGPGWPGQGLTSQRDYAAVYGVRAPTRSPKHNQMDLIRDAINRVTSPQHAYLFRVQPLNLQLAGRTRAREEMSPEK
ncbi:hypothetical protein FB451DRAFT_572709 [Mycena latifolia]|nr:hypothetical protein FB451DRAFT_572709 [Mycena latifolia]